ncbi:MAG: C1 family peptidase [Calditrichaeota bacterium]|nr:C1 family peptidase [Calditrichota bacterium]
MCKRMARSLAGIALVLVWSQVFAGSGNKTGGLSPSTLRELRASFRLDAPTRAILNAVTANDLRSLAINRQLLAPRDTLFAHVIKTHGITNQARSGRCWLFAGLNVIRHDVAKKLNLDNFEFSESYLFFWDKLEKANLFLESIIERRDRDVQDREVEWLLKHPIPDGGQWNMVVDLVHKYGLVPKEVMPESRHTSNTGTMNQLLAKLLRRDAARLRQMAREGKSLSDLRTAKEAMLKDVYRVLAICMGVPPTQFQWRYKDKDGNLSELKTYTPQQFYKEVVNFNLNDYVYLINCPTRPYDRLYQITFDRDLYDRPNMTFVNVSGEVLKECTLKMILDDRPVWFGCDVGQEDYTKRGIMSPGIYDYQALLGVDFSMTKAQRIQYHDSVPTHAMVFVGVDTLGGKPVKWLVENSWGTKVGDKGFLRMDDRWFDEYVYAAIIHKDYLPERVLDVLKTKPTVLPPWDPMYAVTVWE